MPNFIQKIKNVFNSPSTARKAKSTGDLEYASSQGLFLVKEKDLPRLHAAAWRGDLIRVRESCRADKVNAVDKEMRTPIHLAVAGNHYQVVEYLLQEDAKVKVADKDRRTPLVIACMNGNANMLRLLLNHLDDKNVINIPDKHGLNPLFHAIKHPNGQELLALLISKEYVDLNYPNKERNTPLHFAVIHKNNEAISLLCDNGADIDALNAEKKTPCMLAALAGDEKIVEFLLENGADKTIRDFQGRTAFDWAQQSQNPACINVLMDSYHIGPRGTTKITNARPRASSQMRGGQTESQTEAIPSSSDGKKRFEDIFSGKKGQPPNEQPQDYAAVAQSTPATKYRPYDAESNTSRLESEDKSPQAISSRNKSSKANSWSDSDSLDDADLPQAVKRKNSKNIFDPIFSSFNGKSDPKSKKSSMDMNDEKIFDNDAWLDYSSDLPKNDAPADNRNQNNGAPFLTTFTGGSALSKQKSIEKSDPDISANWSIFVHTTDDKTASQNVKNVHLQIFGSRANSTVMQLDKSAKKASDSEGIFEPGKADKFDKSLPDIGRPTKIKIGFDPSNSGAKWHLEKVVLLNKLSQEKFTFQIDRWLARGELDGKTEIEVYNESQKNPVISKALRDSSASSWGSSDDEDSLSPKPSPRKVNPPFHLNELNKIEEEKLNETAASKRSNPTANQSINSKKNGPPQISDFDSSDEDSIDGYFNKAPKQKPKAKITDNTLEYLIKNNVPSSPPGFGNDKRAEAAKAVESGSALAGMWKNDLQKSPGKKGSKGDQSDNEEKSLDYYKNSVENIFNSLDESLSPKKINNNKNKSINSLTNISGENESSLSIQGKNSAAKTGENQGTTLGSMWKTEVANHKLDISDLDDKSQSVNEFINAANIFLEEKPKPANPAAKPPIPTESGDHSLAAFIKLNTPQSPPGFGSDLHPPEPQHSALVDLMKKDLEKEKNSVQSPPATTRQPGMALAGLWKDENAKNAASTQPFSVKNLNKNQFSDDSDSEDPFSNSDARFKTQQHGMFGTAVGAIVAGATMSPASARLVNKPSTFGMDSSPRKQGNQSLINIAQELYDGSNSPRSTINTSSNYKRDDLSYSLLQQQIQAKTDELMSTNQMIEEMRKRNHELESLHQELDIKFKNIEAQKKTIEMTLNRTNELLAEKDRLIESLKTEKTELDMNRKADQNDIKLLHKEISNLKEEKANLEEKIARSKIEAAASAAVIAGATKNSYQTSDAMLNHYQNESLNATISALNDQIKRLNEDRQLLTEQREDLNQKLNDAEQGIMNRDEALKITTHKYMLENATLKQEKDKAEAELQKLSESKKKLESNIENLKSEINEKTFQCDKLNNELQNLRLQSMREKDDIEKTRRDLEFEVTSLKNEKLKLVERLANEEARLISNEKDEHYTKILIDERNKQMEELRNEHFKTKNDLALQTTLLHKEKEEKQALLAKCETLENNIRKHLDEISKLKLENQLNTHPTLVTLLRNQQQQPSSNPDSPRKEADSGTVQRALEQRNKELQHENEALKQQQAIQNGLLSNNGQPSQSTKAQSSPLNASKSRIQDDLVEVETEFMNENAKLKHEIQKLRSDFNTILTRYSIDSNHTTGSIPNLAKNNYPSFSSMASSESYLNRPHRRDPVDVPALITDMPLNTIATLNNYLIKNIISQEAKLNGIEPTPTLASADQPQHVIITRGNTMYAAKKDYLGSGGQSLSSPGYATPPTPTMQLTPPTTCNKCVFDEKTYVDMLKYEMAKRIEVQVAKEKPLSGFASGYSGLGASGRFSSVNSPGDVYLSTRPVFADTYDLSFNQSKYHTSQNAADLLNSWRSKFII